MNWNNIITSAIISLIVSLITFIFGLKAGKNQADRSMLKALYLNLYTHFSKLFDSMSSEKPLRWQSFKKVELLDSTRYLPLVREMIDDGTIVEVNKKMATKMKKMETDILVLSAKQYNCYHRVESIILKSAEGLVGRALIQEYGSYRTTKDIIGKCYISVAYGVFFSEVAYLKVKERLEGNEELSLSFYYTDNQGMVNSITIYQDGNINSRELNDLLKKIYMEINSLDTVMEIVARKNKLLNCKNEILSKLRHRAKDPHRVIETFFGALVDIFK